jgi:D-serine deaminase-like pyridoxal phosphate-dependent protein
MRISRDRGLAAYAYTMLDLGVAAAMTRSRDRWARRLAAATLSTGGGAWILANRFWRDTGRWVDTAAWRD